MDSVDKNENKILSQRERKGELEIISEEKNINGSEENTNIKLNKKSGKSSRNNTNNKNNKIQYSPKYLFKNEDNYENEGYNVNKIELMNYLSESKEKDIIIEEEMQIKSNIERNILSKSYNEINELKSFKEEIDNNKIELPLSNRLNINDKSKEEKEKEKNKESSSKRGALKILELLTSKKKEKEEIEKKKEELIIETFKKARNDNDNMTIKENNNVNIKDNSDIAINDNNNIINENKENKENIDNNIIKEDIIEEHLSEIKQKDEDKENNDKKEISDGNLNTEGENLKQKENIKNEDNTVKEEEKKGMNNKMETNLNDNSNHNEKKETQDISLSSDKTEPKKITENSKIQNINPKIQIQKSNKGNKLYIKNSRKFLKKPINPSNPKNSSKNSFSISKEKSNALKQKRNKGQNETISRYKSFKSNLNTIDYQNKNKKNMSKKNNIAKDNFDTVTVYKKHQLSKSPKGKIYAPKKALNPRGSSINKNNENSLLSKSNININNVNYINNINTIIKNRNDSSFNDNYNEDNYMKLNNSLNINMNNNNYSNFANNYKYIDNYTKYNKNNINYNIIRNYNSNFVNNNQNLKKGLIGSKINNNLNIRHKVVNDNEETDFSQDNINNKYKKNSFQVDSNKNLLLDRFTPDKNNFPKNKAYKNNLSSNPQRVAKTQKNIPSIYQNKYHENNNLSQRYYICNNNQDITKNDTTSKYSSQNYYDANNDIINTEGSFSNTNTKNDNYSLSYDFYGSLNKNSSISINIEDLMIFEEKFSEIIYFLKNGEEVKNQCFDFWNYFFNCSLFERIEKIFKTEKNIEIAKLSINLELISVMICYEFSYDFNILKKSNLILIEILELSHRNIMLFCDNILMKITPDNQKNVWVLKLHNLVQKSKKFIKNNISKISHIDLIKKNSSELSKKLQIIFSSFETEYSPLIFTLFKKIYQKTYSEINDFFIEYILKIENRESSILAPVLLSSNPNFISFRPPYIHTERIKSYTLILDLNDTIVNFQQTNNSQGILRLRPFLIEFLEEISFYYELILFTTSTEYFSKPIIKAIEENKKYFDFIFYREYAIIVGSNFVKDLTRVGRPLDSTIIVDNMPQNFRLQKENGIQIKPFFAQDPNDNTLIELMDILIEIAKSGVDVREGLANYRNDIVQKVTSNISKYDL